MVSIFTSTMSIFFLYSLSVGFLSYFLIMNGYLGLNIKKYTIYLSEINFLNKFVLYIVLISMFIIFIVTFFDPQISEIIDYTYKGLNSFSSEGGSGSNLPVPTGTVSDNTVNVNTPKFSFSLSDRAIQGATTAATTVAGVNAGVRLAQSMPTYGGKAAAIVGTVALAQAVNITATKITNAVNPTNTSSEGEKTGGNNTSAERGTNNYIQDNNLLVNSQNTNVDHEFPMNLLPDLNTYANLELLFLFFILNTALSTFLINKNINFSKYIPNNRLGQIIEKLLARYLKIWYTSNVFVFSLSWVCLFVCIIISKVCLHFLLQV